MRFLLNVSTAVPPQFGVMASPLLGPRRYAGIEAGRPWAADCGAFAGEVDVESYLAWLETLRPHAATCLFVVCPDTVGDALGTLRMYRELRSRLTGWPVAFVAQDGQQHEPLPDSECLFIGGTTAWKVGPHPIECIRRAGDRHIHIGRVNYWRRYRHFAGLPGSEGWTCDGTAQRFEGIDTAIRRWRQYMAEPREPYLPLFGRDRRR